MNWIKNRYDQLILALVAVALLVFAGIVLSGTRHFSDRFADAARNVHQTPITGVDHRSLPQELPRAVWTPGDGEERGSLFVSPHYISISNQPPRKAPDVSLWRDSLTGEFIPNQWFIKHGLPYLESTAQRLDPDNDGFPNEDEWRAGTDPKDSASHPPYQSKLFFKNVARTPVNVHFAAIIDGNPGKPESLRFQINVPQFNRESSILKLGDLIPNTKLKLDKFEPKEFLNKKIGDSVDVSELTVVNTETTTTAVLVVGKVTNVPDEYAVLDYQWPPATGEIRVKQLQAFGLKPETDKSKLYKLIDIRETEAVIQSPEGLEYTVARDPRRSTR